MKNQVLIHVMSLLPFLVSGQSAKEIIRASFDAMGGLEKWREIQYIQCSQVGHKYWLEQSENPEGPFITSYEIIKQTRGVHSNQISQQTTTHQFASMGTSESAFIINNENSMMLRGSRAFPIPPFFELLYKEKARYSPERLLLTAIKSDLTLLEEIELSGTPHYVITFSQDRLAYQLFINQYTKTLSEAKIESFQPYSLYDYSWGKYLTTIKYSLYWLYQGGIRYPAQWDVFKLGKPYMSITHLAIEFKTTADEREFVIPDSIKTASKSAPKLVNEIRFPSENLIEVAEGINLIPGMWNVGTIIQDDGILLIEAPISSGYSLQHLEWVKNKYPDKDIKGVISTSDAWPHIGGIREFVAREIPVYTFFLNEKIIEDVSMADHSIIPDLQQELNKKPKIKPISKVITMQDPNVPIQVIPFNGEGGERMLAIYFPRQRLLYASDLIQKVSADRFFSPQYLSEVNAIVEKYNLEVEFIFAMHAKPTPWRHILEAITN